MPDKHVSDSVAAATPLVSAGLQILQLAIDTHLITSHFALPLVIRDPSGDRTLADATLLRREGLLRRVVRDCRAVPACAQP